MVDGAGRLEDDDREIASFHAPREPGLARLEVTVTRGDAGQNLIVINNGHRDFVYASRNRALKLRYICRLFAKEMVCRNFPGQPTDQLLESMIELSMYTEEQLR